MIKLKDIIFPSISPTNEVIKLFESPVRIPQWVDDNLSNIGKNLAFTKKIRKDYKKIDNFKQFEIYKNTLGKFNYDYFIDGEYIKAFFAYQEYNNGKSFVEEKVWLDGFNIGLCREIVFDYYLKMPSRLGTLSRKRVRKDGLRRAICDYLAGMTDRYAIQEHRRLFGAT